jgi:hypothetical protein
MVLRDPKEKRARLEKQGQQDPKAQLDQLGQQAMRGKTLRFLDQLVQLELLVLKAFQDKTLQFLGQRDRQDHLGFQHLLFIFQKLLHKM